MSKKTAIVILWPFVLLLVGVGLLWILPGDVYRHLGDLRDCYYQYFFSGKRAHWLYTAFVFTLLALSLVYWFWKPCRASLIATMITAWGLCGQPGMHLIFMFTFRPPGDGPLPPLSGG